MTEVDMGAVVEVVSRRVWDHRVEAMAMSGTVVPVWADLPPAHRATFRESLFDSGVVSVTAQVVTEMLAAQQPDEVLDLLELFSLSAGSVLRLPDDRGVAELVEDEKDGLALRQGADRHALVDVGEDWFPMQVLTVAP